MCPFVPPLLASTCRQRYSLHKMAALDPKSPNGGVFQAAFRVPSGCFCHVSQQTPLPHTSGLSGGSAGKGEHSQQSVKEVPVIISTSSQRFTRTQNSGADAFATLDVSSKPQASSSQHGNQDLQHQAWRDQEGSKWEDLHEQPHHNQQPHHIDQQDQQQHHQQHQDHQTKVHQHQQHQNQQHQFQEHSNQQQKHQHQEHQQQNQHQQHQHHLQQTELQQHHHLQQQSLFPTPSPPASLSTPLQPPVPAPHEQQQLLLLHKQESSSKGSLHLEKPTPGANDWQPVTFSPTLRESPETSPHPLVTSYLQVTNITFSRPHSGVAKFETPPPTVGTVSPRAPFQATTPITHPTLTPTTTVLHPITSSAPHDSKVHGNENEFLNVELSPPNTFTTGPVTDSHHSHHPHQSIIGELNHLGVKAVGDNVQVSETGDNNFILTLQQVQQDGTHVPLELLISVDGRLISAASSLSSDSTHTAQRRRGLEHTEVDLQQLPRTVKRYVKELQGKTQRTGGSHDYDDVQNSTNSSGNIFHLTLNNDTSKGLVFNAKLAPIKEREEQNTSDSLHGSGEIEPHNRDSFHFVSSSMPKKAPFPHSSMMTNAPHQRVSPLSTAPPRSSAVALQDSKIFPEPTSPEHSSQQITFSQRDNSFPSLSASSSRPAPAAYPHGRKSDWDISQVSQPQLSPLNSKKHSVPGANRLSADWWASQLFSERPHVIQNYFINFQDNQKKKAASGAKEVSSSGTAKGEYITRQNLGLDHRESFARGPQKRANPSYNITRKTSLSRQRLSSLLPNFTSNLYGKKLNSRVLSYNSSRTNRGSPRFTFPLIVLDQMSNDRRKTKPRGQTAPVFALSRPKKKVSSRTIRDVRNLARNVENTDTKVKIRLKFAKTLTESGYVITHDGKVLQPSSVGRSLYNDDAKSIMTPSRSILQSTLSSVSPMQTARRGIIAPSSTLGHTPLYITTNPHSFGRKEAQVLLADTTDRASFSLMQMSGSQIQPQWRSSLSQGQEFALLTHPVIGGLMSLRPSGDVSLRTRPMITTAAIGQDVFSPQRHSQVHILGSQAQHRPVFAPATRQPSRIREYILSPVLPADMMMADHRERLWGKW